MIDTIYYEDSITNHPRAQKIMNRFTNAFRIPCENHKEIFNPKGQNFRLQKKKPSLILAEKKDNFALPIPKTYGVGGKHNFYFSHMLNCLYDCRYCFLQGMYPSSHYLLFVNYEDFLSDIQNKTDLHTAEPTWFFSGYDCDSLALDNISAFLESFIPFFQNEKNAYLELRTKSVNINPLLQFEPLDNVVTAFSFTPKELSIQLEHGVPSVESRIKAINKITDAGWQVGLRIDPLIDCHDFEQRYQSLFRDIFSSIPVEKIHSVSLGTFRMPVNFFKKIEKLYPEEKLFTGPLEKRGGSISYQLEIEQKRKETCKNLLLQHIPEEKLFLCETAPETTFK